jgi:hypothetical protein
MSVAESEKPVITTLMSHMLSHVPNCVESCAVKKVTNKTGKI